MPKVRESPNQSRQKQLHRRGKKRRLLLIILPSILVIAVAVGITIYGKNVWAAPTAVSSGYTISGTLSYNGSEPPGRVYMELIDSTSGDTGLGTSISSSGKYVIRSVPNGTYVLSAWMDNSSTKTGILNAFSPRGKISVSVNNGNVSEQNITVSDPVTSPTPTPPTNVRAAAANGSAFIQWNAPKDANGAVLADSYNVYYGTSSPVSPSTGIKKTVQTYNHLFLNGLTDGSTYYFVVTSVLAGIESPVSTPEASVIVGATAGSNTISGTVSFPVKATGPIYAGLSGPSGTFFQCVDKPISPQSYSVSGVPNGTYITFAFIDMNNDGAINTGDLYNTSDTPFSGSTTLNVSNDMTGLNQMLSAANVLARVITDHFGSASSPATDIYSLEFEIGGNVKFPVNVVLLSGPNVSAPADMGGFYGYYRLVQTLKAKPKVGDSYVFAMSYSDGTSEKVRVSVTAVLDSFAQNLITSGEERNVPRFNWTAPASPPGDYSYFIQVGERNIGQLWMYPPGGKGMPSSQTSVTYNVDGSASLSALQTGTEYDWLIYVTDGNGNQAVYQNAYTP